MSTIAIEECYITPTEKYCRLTTVVVDDGRKYELWAEVENEYAKFLCSELADGILYLLVPLAIKENKNILSRIPVSEIFLHNINEYFIPSLIRANKELNKVAIEAPLSRLQFNGTAVGTALTGGIDSTYTISQYANCRYPELSLTHLLISTESVDFWDNKNTYDYGIEIWEREHKDQLKRLTAMSADIKLPLIKICTNYYNFLCKKDDGERIRNYYVHIYQTISAVLALKKLWKAYLFSSTVPFNEFNTENIFKQDCAYYDLLSMLTLTIPGFLCISGGVKADRIEKTFALTGYPFAQSWLHPCFSAGDKNCSRPECGKCLRALLTADYYDKLDAFSKTFDIQMYKKNKMDYLVQLIKLRTDHYLKPLYDMFLQKYPKEMSEAQNIVNCTHSPVNRRIYNLVIYAYELSLKFLMLRNFDSLLSRYLSSLNTPFLYTAGTSRLGASLRSRMSKFITIKDIKEANNPEKDNIIILETDQITINKFIRDLNKSSFTNIITLETLFTHLKTLPPPPKTAEHFQILLLYLCQKYGEPCL